MLNIFKNQTLMTTIILATTLFYFGGDIADWVINNSKLSHWLAANKIKNMHLGLDLSNLVVFLVIVLTIPFSILIQMIIEGFADFLQLIIKNDVESTVDVPSNGNFFASKVEQIDTKSLKQPIDTSPSEVKEK
ncbi:hypothetical protein EXT65_21175 [Pectobacterium carotovorum subsp. carotovorum]|nr:hypothetical protein [Pectobacterium carotovorum]MCL6336308.1 hypothetical protein [Pectobacterium carotovorum subsp. carotovorum]